MKLGPHSSTAGRYQPYRLARLNKTNHRHLEGEEEIRLTGPVIKDMLCDKHAKA